MHSNAITYNAERDEIAISVRNFSEIFVIDHSTTTEEAASSMGGRSGKGGDILYRWGNPQSYRKGGEQDRIFYQQHDIRWIPEGHPYAGQFIVYNNGNERPGGEHSSIEIFQPSLNGDGIYVLVDSTFGPSSVSFRYDDLDNGGFYSSIMSSAQPLVNGNILIA